MDRLASEQKIAEALAKVDAILASARRRGDEEEWTRALVRHAQFETALHGYEGAIRFLKEEKRPQGLLPRVVPYQAVAFAREVLEPALDPAERRGVTLAFEPLGPAETDFINTVEQTKGLVRLIGRPNFMMNLDVKAMSTEAIPIADVIRSAKGYVAHVQVNDPNLLGPGMGEVNYEPILAALREIGYDGWLSVEAFDFRPGPEKIARDSIEYLKRVTG